MASVMDVGKVTMEQRTSRYAHLLKPEQLAAAHVAVIGCGAVGRQAAIQLAQMGVGKLTLVDFDKVSPENIGPQGWRPDQVGMPKVAALGQDISSYNHDLRFDDKDNRNDRFRPEYIAGISIVLSCVDNMEVRKEIFEACMADSLSLALFAEARMGAENCIVSYVTNEESGKEWLRHWFPSGEAMKEGCTAKATIFCANVAAAMMAVGVRKALCGYALPLNANYNLMTLQGHANWEPAPEEKEPAD